MYSTLFLVKPENVGSPHPFLYPRLLRKDIRFVFDAQEMTDINMIDSYSPSGFRLTDNSFLIGPSVIFPSTVLRLEEC